MKDEYDEKRKGREKQEGKVRERERGREKKHKLELVKWEQREGDKEQRQ